MNKKQLTLQNSSLFAELERKATEIEILAIRLEEAEQKADSLTRENEMLKSALERADEENEKLFKKNKELESALADAATKDSIPSESFVENEVEANPEILDNEEDEENKNIIKSEKEFTPMDLEIQQKIDEVTELTENFGATYEEDVSESVEEEKTVIGDDVATENTEDNTAAPQPSPTPIKEKNDPTLDMLRDYGAKIIGKVTRVTAEVISKVSANNSDASESLKTLAFGKNESFKFQIMELAKQTTDHEKIMAEMDFLADEAIVYLRSI